MRAVALPHSEPAQPYPVIAGHLLSSAAGFAVLWTLGPGEGSHGRGWSRRAVDARLTRNASDGRHRRLPGRRARPANELDRQPRSRRRDTAGGVLAGLGAGRTPLVAPRRSWFRFACRPSRRIAPVPDRQLDLRLLEQGPSGRLRVAPVAEFAERVALDKRRPLAKALCYSGQRGGTRREVRRDAD
jgi:hypothetical protein